MKLNKGFYPALGTRLDDDGNLMEESYRKQIELMIEAGAAGMLCMGSMGTEDGLSSSTYKKTAAVAADAVRGRVPLFIGAMDNSVFRVKERFEMLEGLNFDGVVLTTPFYSTTSERNLIQFFKEAADASPKSLYMYDLPGVTKQKITFDMVKELMKHPNIKGIKTADTVMIRQLHLESFGFECLYSNLDIFDVACAFGIPRVLDGMFTCVPKNSAAFGKCYANGDVAGVGKYLNNILVLRDFFLENGLWPGYTVAMNLLGLEGNYGRGYTMHHTTPEEIKKVTELMKKIDEID